MQTVAVAIFAVVTIAATDEKNGHFDMVTASSIWVMNDAGCSAQSGSRCSVSRNSYEFTHFSGIATGSNSPTHGIIPAHYGTRKTLTSLQESHLVQRNSSPLSSDGIIRIAAIQPWATKRP
jgi:hypothetical protein